MSMKLLLTGATGAAGLEVLRSALKDDAVGQVTVLSRRPLPPSIPSSPKLNVIIHKDYLNYHPDLTSRFQDHDACIWALGRTSAGMSEKEYTELTHDYPLSAIKAMKDAGMGSSEKKVRFIYFSGEGAEPNGNGKVLFARVKGKTEKDLEDFAKASDGRFISQIIRPGYFFPAHPEDRRTLRSLSLRVFDSVMSPVFSLLLPKLVIPVQQLGQFAVDVAKGVYGDEELFRNARMLELIKEKRKGSSS